MRYYLRFFTASWLLCTFYAFNYNSKKVPEASTGTAFYHFIHIRDTTNTGRIWSEEFMMVFNSEKSIYTSYTKQTQDSIRQAKFEQAIKNGLNNIDMGIIMQTTNDNIYTFEKENTIYVNKNFSNNNYLIKETLEKINWKIDKETKPLLGYTCQKATGICKGREYTVWFTTDLPVSFGPWKLHGLPGLILEAYDTRHQRIQFTCTKIVLAASGPSNISLELPSDAIATTYTEYNRMENAYKESLGIGPGIGEGATVEKATVSRNTPATPHKKFVVNFPLELTN